MTNVYEATIVIKYKGSQDRNGPEARRVITKRELHGYSKLAKVRASEK